MLRMLTLARRYILLHNLAVVNTSLEALNGKLSIRRKSPEIHHSLISCITRNLGFNLWIAVIDDYYNFLFLFIITLGTRRYLYINYDVWGTASMGNINLSWS